MAMDTARDYNGWQVQGAGVIFRSAIDHIRLPESVQHLEPAIAIITQLVQVSLRLGAKSIPAILPFTLYTF